MKNIILFLLGTWLLSSGSHASPSQMDLKKADRSFESRDYYKAIDLYKKAIPTIKSRQTRALLLFKTAECYRLINEPKQAEVYYRKAITAGHADPLAWLYAARAKMKMGNYPDALSDFKKYKDLVPSDPRGELGIKSCQLAVQWMNEPGLEKVENLRQVNTKYWDYAPAFNGKKYNVICFTSTRPGVSGGEGLDQGVGECFADIFETMVDKNGKWTTPVPLPEQVNSIVNEAAAFLNRKGNVVYFTRCGFEENKEITCQLFVSAKRGNAWTAPAPLPFNLDSFNFGHPTVDAAESFMVFASDKPGGFGGLDLWFSVFDKRNNTWLEPVNMGPEINTVGDETYPFIHDDGSLYYSSDGLPGMGGRDIFHAALRSSMKWSTPVNLKYPMNSSGDDFGIIFEGKKMKGYFSSDREGGKGGDDIYSFYVAPVICTLDGYVWEREKLKQGIKEPVKGALVRLVSSAGNTTTVRTDEKGYYTFNELISDLSYVIQTKGEEQVNESSKLKYLGKDQGKFTTIGLTTSTHFKQDLSLLQEEEKMRLPDILYLVDQHDLNHPSNPKDSLEYLYKILTENPGIIIELASHTDFRDSHKHNDSLSYRRARSVVEYMISKGIAPGRMKAKGYGERQPLVLREDLVLANGKRLPKGTKLTENLIKGFKPGTADYELLNQLNRRTEFSVIGRDFSQKGLGEEVEKLFPEIQIDQGGDER